MASLFPRLRNNKNAAYVATFCGRGADCPALRVGTMGNAVVRAWHSPHSMCCWHWDLISWSFRPACSISVMSPFTASAHTCYALLASPHLASNFPWIAQTFPNGLHSSVWLVIPLGAAIAGFLGCRVGGPGAQVGRDYLAIVTLGFAKNQSASFSTT